MTHGVVLLCAKQNLFITGEALRHTRCCDCITWLLWHKLLTISIIGFVPAQPTGPLTLLTHTLRTHHAEHGV